MKTSRHVAYLFCKNHLVTAKPNRHGEHAEMCVLPYVDMRKRYKLYVTRHSRGGLMSRPCSACSGVLRRYQNIRVFYSNAMGEWIEDMHLDNTYCAAWKMRASGRLAPPNMDSSRVRVAC